MPQPQRNLSLERWYEHRLALEHFRREYVAYLNAGPGGPPKLRARANGLIPAAHLALEACGMGMAWSPPPVAPGPTMHGLSNIAFLHEQPGWRLLEGPGTPGLVMDVTEQAIGFINETIKDLKRKRRTPLYWLDRSVRGVLGIPAYIVSALLGSSRWDIEESKAGLPLRVLAAAASVATIVGVLTHL